jgi:UDP-2,3-diacylglucosamine pyrophosphatase LpxH
LKRYKRRQNRVLGSTDEDPYKQIDLIGANELATVFFSDTHCGDNKSKHKELLTYLVERQKDIDKIVIVGDFLDTWVASTDRALSEAEPLLEFLSTNYAGKLHYLLGNHDAGLLPLKKVFPFIHTSLRFPVGDKVAVCLHGNVLDDNPYLKTRFSRWMAWFINKFDAWAKIDTRKSLVSLSERIKNDPYDKVIAEFEQKIVDVFDGKFDYVITGHTHLYPYVKKLNNVTLINIGDNIQHTTVLIAKKDAFYLFDYTTKKTIAVERT